MADIYTNLPPKEKDKLDKTIENLTKTQYQEEYQFNVGEYDAAVAFFVKRGFNRPAAESTAYVILSQAKIDSLLDSLMWLVFQLSYQNHLYLLVVSLCKNLPL